MWNKASLHDLINERLNPYQLIVVANREPYVHNLVGNQIVCSHPASGMATALDPVMRACGGIWVAHGSGSADRRTSDPQGHILVPPDEHSYTLRRVWLNKRQEDGYYFGLANEGLWPLCHHAYVRPVFQPEDWDTYREVNRLFADAVLQEAGDKPTFVFVQDYHFGLLPRMLKQSNPGLIIAQFWHIPWPNREQFRTFPWSAELLDGLLGNDLLGFHLRSHCHNFLDAIDRFLEARVDQEQSEVTCGGKSTVVRPFPISIDFEGQSELAASPEVVAEIDRWRQRLGLSENVVGLGIDRIDYTKGIPDRLRGLDRFFEKFPQYQEHVVFIQVGVPSRSRIASYKLLDDEIDDLVEQINWRWGTDSWTPIVYFKRHLEPRELAALHQLASFCLVSSLHDGLNLVAKEFVASRNDEDGVLILSEFTGASRELTDALLINPYSLDMIADSIRQAIEMPQPERRRRMQKLRAAVSGNNVYRWAGKIIHALLKFDFPEETVPLDNGSDRPLP